MAPLLLLVGCDHATKSLAKAQLEGAASHELLHGVLSLRYLENTDIAFNLLRWIPETTRKPLLLALGGVAVLLSVVLLLRVTVASRTVKLGILLIAAGAIGNYLDRVLRGYVVDFVHLHHWPVFNVADMYVCAGYGLLAYVFLAQRRRVNTT